MTATARRPGGSWISQNYDKLALVVVLAALLASALMLVTRIGGNRRTFDQQTWQQATVAGRKAEPVDVASFSNIMARLAKPFQVAPQNRRMLVGELRVASIPDGAPIAYNATEDPFSKKPQPAIDYDPDSDGDGISDKSETALGLNPSDPADAQADLDGDGYTNAEEHSSGSDIRDAKSFPPPPAKLRLARTIVNPFKLRFLGISRLTDGDRYQLNLRTLERTYFPRMGDEVEGYKLVSYDEQSPEGPTLVLQKGGQAIRLVQGRVINQEARMALLVFLLDGARWRVQIGDQVKLKDRTYKVVDIKDDRVVIRDEQEGKNTTVGRLSDEEAQRLQGGGGSGANAAAPGMGPAGSQP